MTSLHAIHQKLCPALPLIRNFFFVKIHQHIDHLWEECLKLKNYMHKLRIANAKVCDQFQIFSILAIIVSHPFCISFCLFIVHFSASSSSSKQNFEWKVQVSIESTDPASCFYEQWQLFYGKIRTSCGLQLFAYCRWSESSFMTGSRRISADLQHFIQWVYDTSCTVAHVWLYAASPVPSEP